MSTHIIWCNYIRIVRQGTGQLLGNLCKNIVNMIKKLIWTFIDIFPKA